MVRRTRPEDRTGKYLRRLETSSRARCSGSAVAGAAAAEGWVMEIRLLSPVFGGYAAGCALGRACVSPLGAVTAVGERELEEVGRDLGQNLGRVDHVRVGEVAALHVRLTPPAGDQRG